MMIHLLVDLSEFPDDDDPDYDTIFTEVLADAIANGCYEVLD